MGFAERAAKSAPQNAELWFLLGYADRLADHYQASVDAYNRGLKIQPGSVRGMAGLAQTYAKMGRDADAEQLLKRVVDANPKDANSLQLAGELLLNSDPTQALELLKRADMLQASPHTDLLIAHAYERLGQPDQFTHYLNLAKRRAPNDPEVLRAVAGEYRDQGQYDQAIATLQAIPNKTVGRAGRTGLYLPARGEAAGSRGLVYATARRRRKETSISISVPRRRGWEWAGRMRLVIFWKTPSESTATITGCTPFSALSPNRTIASRMRAAEYNLALANLPAHVPEGPLYPIELRLNLYELDLRQDDQAGSEAATGRGVRSNQSSERARVFAARNAEAAGCDRSWSRATWTPPTRICRRRFRWRHRISIHF